MSEGEKEVKCIQVPSGNELLVDGHIPRRQPVATDVELDIHYAGICHSDISQGREHWGPGGRFPMVPGHEIVGVITKVGRDVPSNFQIGSYVGIGCLVGSCQSCQSCNEGEEQYCHSFAVGTYNSAEKYPHMGGYNEEGGAPTYGGYSTSIVAHHKFVCPIPTNFSAGQLPGVAPLLCAGITVFSPLKRWETGPGKHVAVAGLGGLGAMAVKIAKAMGASVTVLSRGDRKRSHALETLGADDYIDTTNRKQLKQHRFQFDLIIDTIPADHEVSKFLPLTVVGGAIAVVGVPGQPFSVPAFHLTSFKRVVTGSSIGGIAETNEMLQFCADHGITSTYALIDFDPSQVNEAWDNVDNATMPENTDRYVIDIKKVHKEGRSQQPRPRL